MNPYYAFGLLGMLVVGIGAAIQHVRGEVWPRYQMRRRLAAGSSALEDLAIATIEGTVQLAEAQLVAPRSGRTCVLYLAHGQLPSGAPGDPPSYSYEQRAVAFELVTTNGVVLVDAEAAELELAARSLIPRNLERERAFLIAHGHPAQDLRGSAFQELAITPGERLRIRGMVQIERARPTGELGYREAAPRIRLVTPPDGRLTIGGGS